MEELISNEFMAFSHYFIHIWEFIMHIFEEEFNV
jgi:hypothetical protein